MVGDRMRLHDLAKKHREPETDVNSLFYSRWSPRVMSGKKMTKKELLPLFEAAKWAPSAFNGQPWKFVVALTKKDRDKFMEFLVDFNKEWCKNASALVVIISNTNFEYNGKPNPTHSFDTGAAWASLALEGARRGLVIHGMSGFDYEKAKKNLKIPKDYKVEAMCAIGRLGNKSDLPEDIASKDIPSQRKKVNEIVNFNGKFKK